MPQMPAAVVLNAQNSCGGDSKSIKPADISGNAGGAGAAVSSGNVRTQKTEFVTGGGASNSAQETMAKPEKAKPAAEPPRTMPARGMQSEEPVEFLEDIPWDENAPGMSDQAAELMMSDWNEYADAGGGEDDDEEESSINSPEVKKRLEVSSDRPKTAAPVIGSEKGEQSEMQRWKSIVENLREPLSTIMAGARVDCFSRNSVEVTLPVVYRMLITDKHVREVDRVLAHHVYQGCRFAVHFDEIGDETQTLTAMKAREQFESEQRAFERVREHAVMKTIIEVFNVNPDEIRFTINPDRTTNEQSH